MKRILLAIAIAAALLSSCSIENTTSGSKVVFVSVAFDYTDTRYNVLSTTLNDQKGYCSQLELLSSASGCQYEEYRFTSSDEGRIFTHKLDGVKKSSSGIFTKETILSTLRDIETDRNDIVIFHYSGHGLPDGGKLAIVDQEPEEPGSANRGLSFIDKSELLNSIRGLKGKKLLILDSCYSGSFIEYPGALSSGQVFQTRYGRTVLQRNTYTDSLGNAIASLFGHIEDTDGIWVLSAASSAQVAKDSWAGGLENQDKYGAFTFYILRAMGFDTDAMTARVDCSMDLISAHRLYRHAISEMSQSLYEESTPQTTMTPVDLVLFQY